MKTCGIAVCGAAVMGIAGAAQGQFYMASVDFGGPFVGVNGSPIVPLNGRIIAVESTSPGVHLGHSALFGGADGWGTTVGGIDDEAPVGIPGDPRLGSFVTDPVIIVVPHNGDGGAAAHFFGGYYGGNDTDAAFAAVILAEDNDVWVARIRVTGGAILSTSGPVYIAVRGIADPEESILGINETGVIDTTRDNRSGAYDYWLEYREVENLFPDGSDVYDVFVVSDSSGGGGPGPAPAPAPAPDPESEPEFARLDFNHDLDIDNEDLRYLLLSYGPCQSGECQMDLNGDSYIDGADVSGWIEQYQSTHDLDKADKKTLRRVVNAVKKAGKIPLQQDKKRAKLAQLVERLSGEISAKRWSKLSKKISKLNLAIDKLEAKFYTLLQTAADRT